ncbi:FimV family protein [Lacisediminimonas profundi]|uniref:FimV family protein n=1 Tax=Lacisediminimonas profundi TaxID=2603856 RepID=UPI0019D69D22|nr:FimV family protein [Lacisediminimonas profundi]
MTAAMFSGASAAGLGKITVLSGLGQPLNAEIELTSVGRDEASGLAVKLAPLEAFRQANIELNPALYGLRFAVEQRGARHVVRITSAKALNEPFVDLLLEVTSANSRLVREYTFLLDPPELRSVQPAQTAQAPAAGQAPASQDAAAAGKTARPAKSDPATRAQSRRTAAGSAENARRPAPAASPGTTSGQEIQVKRGDTLGRIAADLKPEGVSLDQMLVALYRANPDAFAGNNMNRLRSGQILKVPDSESAGSTTQGEARGVIVAQAADFNSYRAKLAGQAATAAPRGTAEAGQTAGGKITARVEEQATPANTAKDRLTVSSSGLAQGAAAGPEDKIARDKAAADAQGRVRELEKNVSDLQKLLELKNKGMADQQQQAGSKPDAAMAAGAAAGSAGAPAPAGASPAPAAPVASGPGSTPPAAAVAGPTPAPAAVKPPARPKIAPPPPPPPPTLVEEVLDNPLLLGAGGLLLAALAWFGIRIGRKRRELRKQFSDSAILSETGMKTNSLFGTTGGQSVDTNNSVFNSSFTPSASQLDTNEVDPVAEADVYIAYGRDAQAEEILREALRTQPERHAVRLKLLEIYASRRDLRAFDTVASELYSMTKGECPEWEHAVELGATIDPANPLYANARKDGQAAAPVTRAGTDDLDLDALLNTTSGAHAEGQDDSEGLVFDDAPAPAAPAPAMVAAQATAPVAAVEAPADTNLLEFDSPEPVRAAAALAAPDARIEPASEGNTLDFDFDLGDLTPKRVALSSGTSSNLSSDASLSVAPEPEIASESLPALSDEIAAPVVDAGSEPSAFDFNFDLLKPVEPRPVEALPAIDGMDDEPEELEVGIPALTQPLDEASDRASLAAGFDLSSISLELDPQATAAAEEPKVAEAVAGNAEMATKLDLALAYQEIGDTEGARELLAEVLKGGTPDQVATAQAMLLNIG